MTRIIEDGVADATVEDAERVMVSVGRQVRERRKQRSLTLLRLSELTGVSPSMLSMLERGLSSASVGTLVAVASALNTNMADLFGDAHPVERCPVVRRADQPAITTPHGATRRVVHRDEQNGLEIAVNNYEPGGSSGEFATHHAGVEAGVVLAGALRIEIESDVYELESGDAIEYHSMRPHRISSLGGAGATAVWVNLDRAGGRPRRSSSR